MENQSFRKVFGLVPEELYLKLVSKGKFNSNWDYWLTKAILHELEKEDF